MREKEVFEVIRIIIDAGKAILEVYDSADFGVEYKADDSPLTKADLAAHEVIKAGLEILQLDGKVLPLLSEEGRSIPHEERKSWNRYWLIDPLDGTKEFVKRNGEFTVNIALIENGIPVAGFVYLPVKDVLYFGVSALGSFRVENAAITEASDLMNATNRISGNDAGRDVYRVVASRSHLTPETEEFIDSLRNEYENIELISSGSSIKLCMVAEGQADVYPRFAPTMEWDTAAADAVCRAAGCQVQQHPAGLPLEYNKENLLNPWFIVKGKSYGQK